MGGDAEIKNILEDHERRISKLEKILEEKKMKVTSKHNPNSVVGLIEQLKSEGFFNQPRTLKEIQSALAKENFHYAVTSLTNPLQRLVRQRILGRMLQNGKWAYVKR